MTKHKIVSLLICFCIIFCNVIAPRAEILLITLDRVNFRERPSTESNVLQVLDPQTNVTVVEIQSDGWARVVHGGQSGFIMTEYLGSPDQNTPPVQQSAVANPENKMTLDRVNLREQASTESNVLQVLDPQTSVTVVEIQSDGWARVVHGSQSGFILAEYLGSHGQNAPPAQQNTAVAENLTTLDRVNLREQPSTSSNVLRVLEPLTNVTVTERLGEWVKLNCAGDTGYVMAEYIGSSDQYIPDSQKSQPVTENLVTIERVNLRAQASTSSNVLSVLDPLTSVAVAERQGDWARVIHEGNNGYIMAEYLGTKEQYKPSVQAAAAYTEKLTLDRVNMREQPSMDGRVLQVLDPRTSVAVTNSLDSGWLMVVYNGQNGYIKSNYVGTAQEYDQYAASASQSRGQTGQNIELLDWPTVKPMIPLHVALEVTDVYSGRKYYVKSFSNGKHADVEPVTVNDTAILKETYGGRWDWDARPVLVSINGRTVAAAINGMPHASGVNNNNGMDGQICLHFKNSSVHNGNMSYNSTLQRAVLVAYNTYNK